MASINPTSIPSITALRQDLNYGDAKLPRCQAFYEDVRLFRKKYISSQGLEGGSLHEWKLREHQNALGEMTRAFLDRDGNGRHYWPDDETSPRYNGLKYSSGHARIKKVLKQLFFRLNLQQHRNSKYRKNKADEADPSKRSGMTPADAIEIDGDGHSPMDASEQADTPRSATARSFSTRPFTEDIGTIDPALHTPGQSSSRVQEPPKDPYRVPESPGPRPQIPQDKPMFPPIPTAASAHARRSASRSEDEPTAKRAKTAGSSSVQMSSAAMDDEAYARMIAHNRISPRKRKPRINPDLATPEQIAAALSPERSPSPAVAENSEASVSGAHAATATVAPPVALRPHWGPLQPSVEDALDEDATDTFIEDMTAQMSEELGLHFIGPIPYSAGTNVAPLAQMVPVKVASEPPTPTNAFHPGVPMMTASPYAPSLIATAAQEPPRSEPPQPEPPQPESPRQEPPAAPEDEEKRGDEANEKKSAAKAPATKKPRVEFAYRVITRKPAYRGDDWVPEGSFRDKTISELERELPIRVDAADLIGLRFVLLHVSSETRAEQIIPRGHDRRFVSAKRYFDGVIRSCIAMTPAGEQALIEFEIEALTEDKPAMDETFEEAYEW